MSSLVRGCSFLTFLGPIADKKDKPFKVNSLGNTGRINST